MEVCQKWRGEEGINVVISLEQFHPEEDAPHNLCGRVRLIRQCGRAFLASVR